MYRVLITGKIHPIGVEKLSKEPDPQVDFHPDMPIAEIGKIMLNRGTPYLLNRGTPYLFRRLFWFPAWFLGCQDAVEGGLKSGEKGLVSHRASGLFMSWPFVVRSSIGLLRITKRVR